MKTIYNEDHTESQLESQRPPFDECKCTGLKDYECDCGSIVCKDCGTETCDFCGKRYCKGCFAAAKKEVKGGIDCQGTGLNVCYSCAETESVKQEIAAEARELKVALIKRLGETAIRTGRHEDLKNFMDARKEL